MTSSEILSKINFSRTYVCRSKMCSGNEYKIRLSYNGNSAWFVFHDNFENKSTLKDWLYCLIMDMDAFEYSKDAWDFARNFGYADEDYTKACKAYKACKKTSEKLHKLFSESELEILSEIE